MREKGRQAMQTTRRDLLKGVGAMAVGGRLLGAPAGLSAQARKGVPAAPVKIGILAIQSGVGAPVGAAGLRGVEWWTARVNTAGGILGRKVELVVEEESSPKETVERFRKLALQTRVEVISGGISTAVGLALGPAAEELVELGRSIRTVGDMVSYECDQNLWILL
jgi:branched-chain amino acid transport system substrate-binding protein